ncbi:hypothetical protein AMATHDRAFT_156174 [Amanita thiersii Skay4041]|uniref:Uncharacterized protein n=1 Tax=Amanita thiersii Skay4041 TaxID=703135 RepID=A0A2A9N7N2_9AGAR|nr:hypothetical protein AMATHDRAFT_156174 [Amanita thiersii Skay4041]
MSETYPDALHLPPPGLNFISVVQPSLGILIAALTGTAILVPLWVILFFFSTKQLRRKPIFIMNVISIMLGVTLGISTTYIMYQEITNPQSSFGHVMPACQCLITITPSFVESILLFRLLAVYPYHATSSCVFISIFFPLICIKIARVVSVAMFVYHFVVVYDEAASPFNALQVVWLNQIHFLKIEYLLQVIDNT